MAKFDINNTTSGLRGAVDQFVYKNWFGKTIAAKRPKKRSSQASSTQLGIRSMFKEAVRYAKAATKDPATKALYKMHAKPGQSAYNMAFADFFSKPEIGLVDTSAYNERSGSFISIEASDDTKVMKLEVKIVTARGELVEQGEALPQADGLHWVYTSTKDNGSIPGSIITVTAFDMPGHSTVNQKTL